MNFFNSIGLLTPNYHFSSVMLQQLSEMLLEEERRKHREDWEAAANENWEALSHAHCTSVQWRQSPVLQHTDESLYGTDVHEGLVAPDVKDAVVMLQQVKHSLEVEQRMSQCAAKCSQ